MSKKLTTEEFIKKAKKIHGDKYNYSLVNYINSRTKIKIICPKHGIFEQTPNNHISKKYKCPSCKSLSTEEFIKRAKKVHGDKYNYSLVNYTNKRTKVKIICPEHGVFEQIAQYHMRGSGCKKCSHIFGYTTEEFIKKAKKIHDDRYDYSLVNYINSTTKIKIICPEHGIFKQSPKEHLSGQGCIKCKIVNTAAKLTSTTEEFIKHAKKIHGDKYNYSLVNYVNSKTKVKIICPIHSEFEQTPGSHLNNHGCPVCNESKGEKEIAQYLNGQNIKYIREYKFDNCRNIQTLPFDFYLPDKNILIEYDGIQHFKSIEYFGGNNVLLYIKHNDNIKTKYCHDNNIQLIRINYKDNIKKSLKFIL